jgi:hypothetical protein
LEREKNEQIRVEAAAAATEREVGSGGSSRSAAFLSISETHILLIGKKKSLLLPPFIYSLFFSFFLFSFFPLSSVVDVQRKIVFGTDAKK